MPRVTSPDNPRFREALRLLASSRDRRKIGRCVLEGAHLIEVYLVRYGVPETLVVLDVAAKIESVRRVRGRVPGARTLIVDAATWTEFTQLPIDVAVLAVVPTPHAEFQHAADFCLLLEDIQDPGNVGSILRTAAAAGVAQVFMSRHCAFAWSPKVLRAAQGGHFHLEIFEDVDLAGWARHFRGAVVATLTAGGEALFDADLRGPIALAIGNEGAGLSAALTAAAQRRITIPMPGGFESLNAAAAAAVCLFECVRQRGRVS